MKQKNHTYGSHDREVGTMDCTTRHAFFLPFRLPKMVVSVNWGGINRRVTCASLFEI